MPSSNSGAPDVARGYFYILPFLLLLVGRTFVSSVPMRMADVENSPSKMALLGLAYLSAILLLVLSLKEIRPLFVKLLPLLLYALWAALTMLWSLHPDVVMMRVVHITGLFCVALCTALWAQNRPFSIFPPAFIYLSILLLLSLLTVKFFPERGLVHPEWAESGGARWMGLTSSPNHLGAIAFIGIWVALALFMLDKRLPVRACSLLAIIVACIDLKGSDSRTSEVCVVFLLGLALMLHGEIRPSGSTILRRLLILAATLGIAFFFLYQTDSHLMQQLMPQAREGAGDALSDRPAIWAAGLQGFLERPYGWSFDQLETYWEMHGNLNLFPHMHNGYLDVLVKGGVISEALLLFILFRMACGIKRISATHYRLAKIFLLFFLCNIVYNLTEGGFDREEPLWPMMVVAWACTEAIATPKKQGAYTIGPNGFYLKKAS